MSAARRLLADQLAEPRGLLGRQAAREMALVNRRMIEFSIQLLDVRAGLCVLEIGFGGGRSLGRLADLATGGRVIGVDHSQSMVAIASRRHRRAIRAGTMQIHHAPVDALPIESRTVDRVLSVNCLPYWPDVGSGMAEVGRVLGAPGRAVISVRPPEVMRQVGVEGPAITLLDEDGLRSVAASADLHVIEVARADDKLGGSRHLVVTKD
jgi:SAM-dependent methyltransferase